MRKISLLLDAFEKIGKPIDYYALDLSEEELQRTLLQVPDYKHVRSHGLWGTYDDGKDWLKQFADSDRNITIIHLGSSIGTCDAACIAAISHADMKFRQLFAPGGGRIFAGFLPGHETD